MDKTNKQLGLLKTCTIKQRSASTYVLTCKISGRGAKDYKYDKKGLAVMRDGNVYEADEKSMDIILKAVSNFDELIYSIKNDKKYKVIIFKDKDEKTYTYIFNNGIDKYNVLLQEGDGKSANYKFFENVSVDGILSELEMSQGYKNIFKKECGDINSNPLYLYAKENDLFMQYQIEQLYGLSNEQTREYLFNRDGVLRIAGGNKYEDKFFSIKNDEIDFNVIKKSGYTLYHIPCSPLMEGKTRDICMFNPNKMQGKDAAPKNSELTSWKTFCELLK